MKAADADKKRKEQDVAMAAAMEKAKADAAAAAAKAVEEAKAAAEAQLAESRRLAVEKLERDMQRPTYEGKTEEANEKEYMARSSLARASVNAGKAMPRRSSVNAMMAAAQAAQATTTAADASLDPRVAYAEGMPDMPSVPGAGDGGAVDVDGDTPALGKTKSAIPVEQEEFFDVTIVRDMVGGTLGIAVDLWDGEVTVGAITAHGPADREGTLIQGDIIRAVEGVMCATIEEVTAMVIKGSVNLRLSICRRPVKVVLESEIKMKMPTGEWEPFSFKLLSNRNIEFEKLSPPQYSGEIAARLAHSLNLLEDRGDKVLEIVTGHKAFQIRSPISAEVDQWHLRLQEVIMLQEKVANVAHGWLLKEEGGGGSGGGSQLKHFWFVLFSNGILMFFTDPNRAVLGQALGFIPVEQCTETSHSAKQHTLLVKCSFSQWLLATNSKENMLQWAASLHAAQPSKKVERQAVDAVLAQGWLDLPKEDETSLASGGVLKEVWVRHWFLLRNTVLNVYTEEQKHSNDLSQPIVALAVDDMRSATRAKGVDFYK
jgi:hypothetical protein